MPRRADQIQRREPLSEKSAKAHAGTDERGHDHGNSRTSQRLRDQAALERLAVGLGVFDTAPSVADFAVTVGTTHEPDTEWPPSTSLPVLR